MSGLAETLGAPLFGALVIILIINAILWFFLPFEIFGMKKRLDRIAARQSRTNDLLEQISMQLEQQAAANDEREG